MYNRERAAARFRNKAEECLALAEHMADPVARDSLLQVAIGYQHLAAMIQNFGEISDRLAARLGTRQT